MTLRSWRKVKVFLKRQHGACGASFERSWRVEFGGTKFFDIGDLLAPVEAPKQVIPPVNQTGSSGVAFDSYLRVELRKNSNFDIGDLLAPVEAPKQVTLSKNRVGRH